MKLTVVDITQRRLEASYMHRRILAHPLTFGPHLTAHTLPLAHPLLHFDNPCGWSVGVVHPHGFYSVH